MSARRLGELTRRERRRATAASTGRCALSVAAVIALYCLLPLDGGPDDAWALLRLFIGVLVFVGAMVFAVRRIIRAELPQLVAVEALAVALPLFLVLFASAYDSLDHLAPGSFTERLDRTAGLYFAIVTLGTVGYGDITAKTDLARILVSVQVLIDLAFLALMLRLVVGAARIGLRREEPASDDGAPDRPTPDP